jgi:hypothetical protein
MIRRPIRAAIFAMVDSFREAAMRRAGGTRRA